MKMVLDLNIPLRNPSDTLVYDQHAPLTLTSVTYLLGNVCE